MSRSPRKAPPSAPAEPLARGAREHYDDAVYYDYTYRRRRDDVEYYRRVARQYGGPVDADFMVRAQCYRDLDALQVVDTAVRRDLPEWLAWGRRHLSARAAAATRSHAGRANR